MEKVAEMTYDELKQLIRETVDEQLALLIDDFEITDADFANDEPPDLRTLDEVFKSIHENRWTPPPDSKSSLELLREDRDR